jgi:phosphate transport system substrate-binding protein
MSWTCNGTVENPHPATENEDGITCGTCGKSVDETKKPKGNLPVVMALGAIAVLAAGVGIYSLVKPQTPSPSISSVSSTSSSTPSPSSSATTTSSSTPPSAFSSFTSVTNVPKGLFFYGGSTSLAPLRSDSIENQLRTAQPDFDFRYKHPTADSPGSLEGIRRVIRKALSFAHSSRALKPEEYAAAKNLGFDLKEVSIAYDAIAIYVNVNLSEQQLKGLTIEQVRDIFTGKITNWRDVGGPDLPIVPFTRAMSTAGTVDYFHDEVLKKQAFGKFEVVENTTKSIQRIQATNGSIGYATASEVINQPVRALPIAGANSAYVSALQGRNQVNKQAIKDGSYPISRPLFVIYRLDGSPDQQAGEAYINMILSDQGQKLVDQVGFVPVR